MKFSTREDVEAPIDATFDMLTDHEGFARQAIRRGAEVQRTDSRAEPGPGMMWDVAFSMRGRRRQLSLQMDRFDRPNEIGLSFVTDGLTGTFTAECLALSKNRTRVQIALELSPQNLSARLLVQSLKLAKTSLTKRFKLRVADYAKTMEERYQSRSA
ncbi:MAG: SRPBCC family protein [Pseudomonadota bacterium]